MSDPVIATAEVFAASALAGAAVWAAKDGQPIVTRELRLPSPLDSATVEELVRLVASSARGPVTISVDATEEELRLYLSAPRALLSKVSSGWLALVPGARLEKGSLPDATFTAARRLRSSKALPLLREDALELASSAILGALRPLQTGERVRVVARMWPLHRRFSVPEVGINTEQRLLRAKFRGAPLTAVELVVGTTSTHHLRGASVLERIVGPLRTRQSIRGRLVVAGARGARANRWLTDPLPWWLPSRRLPLTPAEAVGLLPLPVGDTQVAGLSFEVSPRRPAPHELPRLGRIWGLSTWPSQNERPLIQPQLGIPQHQLVSGPTGSGKSVLLLNLIRQTIQRGDGALIIDVKGDLATEVLAHIPGQRQDDVIVLDPSRSDFQQPGLRVFGRHGDPDLTADLLVGTFKEIFPDSFGIRTASYLRLGAQTLARTPDATLLELPLLFADAARRRRVVGRISDPLLRASWARFEALSAAEQVTHLTPLLTRLDELLARPAVRVVLGQPAPKLSFSEVLARRRIVVVRAPRGLLGEAASRLLTSLVIWQAFQAVLARADLPPERRSLFEFYLDEAGALGRLPLPLDSLLEQVRGFNVGVTLAPQSLAQLPPVVQAAVAQNVSSIAAFRQQDIKEARALSALLPGISPEELQSLGRYEIALRLGLGPGAVPPVMTGRTLPAAKGVNDPAHVSRHAAHRWGVSLADVDAHFARTIGMEPNRATDPSEPDTTRQAPPGARRQADRRAS